MTWQDTSKTKNESDDSTICVDPENAKPIFSLDRDSQDTYRGTLQNWPPHSFDNDPITGEIRGYWTGHCYSQAGESIISALGLTQLKLEVSPDDNSLLTGFAVTFSGRLDLYGRRRSIETEGESTGYEQIDVVMWFEDGYSVRLVGKLNQLPEESLGGSWATFTEKEEAKEMYDKYPFDEGPSAAGVGEDGDGPNKEEYQEQVNGETDASQQEDPDTVDPKMHTDVVVPGEGETNPLAETGSGTKPTPLNDEDTETQVAGSNEDGAVALAPVEATKPDAVDEDDAPTIRFFVFRRTPVEVCKFRDLLYEDDKKARARWNFLRESVLHVVRCRLWSWKHIKSWGENRRKFLDFYRRNWLLATCNFMTPNPLTPEERSIWYDLKWELPPSNIRLCVEVLSWSLYRLPFQ
jgi:hypothetical protein